MLYQIVLQRHHRSISRAAAWELPRGIGFQPRVEQLPQLFLHGAANSIMRFPLTAPPICLMLRGVRTYSATLLNHNGLPSSTCANRTLIPSPDLAKTLIGP